ncbi:MULTISPECIES: hypothetical protein [unclassified Microcoleus]|uniref:hypothetical protein n=1 Tax=unclassified Microcoleus TaxID=2642155 RepID=UPI002FCFCECF
MQKIEKASFPASRSAPNQPDWLEFAEYASVAGSAIGAIAAGLSGQILYAAAPLTAAISLNLANRQRFEQQMQHKANSAIADVQAAVERRSQQVQMLPVQPAELYTAVSDLQHKILGLESGAIAEVQAAVASLERQAQALPGDSQEFNTQLLDLQQKLGILENSALRAQDWENVNVRFLLMDEKLTEVKTITAQLQERSNKVDLDQIPGSLKQLQDVLDRPTIDAGKLQTEIQHLQQQVSQLQRQNQEIVKPYLQRLTRAVKKLSTN